MTRPNFNWTTSGCFSSSQYCPTILATATNIIILKPKACLLESILQTLGCIDKIENEKSCRDYWSKNFSSD